MSYDGEAEPETSVLAGPRIAGLLEAVEDRRPELGGKAFAGVGDRQPGFATHVLEQDPDATARRGELDRVVDQVADHLLEPRLVAAHDQRSGREPDVERDAFRLGRRPQRLERLVELGREIHWGELEGQLPGDDAGDVEEVVDQLGLGPDAALENADGPGPRRCVVPTAL